MYYIIPTNEGHDMNYSETSPIANLAGTKIRAKEMGDGLKSLLPKASISCRIENTDGDQIALYDADMGAFIPQD